MSPEDSTAPRARLEAQIEHLGAQLDALRERVPSPEELEHWRQMALADERATWARKKLAVLVPILVGIVTVVFTVVDWIRDHVSVR